MHHRDIYFPQFSLLICVLVIISAYHCNVAAINAFAVVDSDTAITATAADSDIAATATTDKDYGADFRLEFEIIKSPTTKIRSPRAAAASHCANVMPGLNRLRRGVDVTRLDLLSLSSGDDGFRKPIVDFSCSGGKKINVKIPGGQFRSYDLPDEIWDVAALPGGFLSGRVEIFKSSQQVQKSMASSAGVDIIGGVFSASASYEKMSSSLMNQSRYLETVESVVSASRVDLAPFWGFDLSHFAKMFVDRRLPNTFEENPQRYAEFISYFGTHYFAHGKFGGLVKLLLETETSYFDGKTESKVKAQAGGMFKNFLKAKGGYDGATVTIDEEFKRKTTQTIRYHGGDTNLLDSEGLRRWQPTVAENPWLFGGELKPLTDLFDDDAGGKKKAMQRAVEVHLDKARLNAAKRLVYAGLHPMYDADAATVAKLKKFLTDCDALLRLPSPESFKVDALVREIEGQVIEVIKGVLKNGNVVCWTQCGAKGGPCSFCGGGSCCRKGWTGGAGCTGINGCDGDHCCVKKGTLRNGNVDCWLQCGTKGGPCSFCGSGLCCRKGLTGGAGCTGTNGCHGYHCCVERG